MHQRNGRPVRGLPVRDVENRPSSAGAYDRAVAFRDPYDSQESCQQPAISSRGGDSRSDGDGNASGLDLVDHDHAAHRSLADRAPAAPTRASRVTAPLVRSDC